MAKGQKNKKTTTNRFRVIEWVYMNLPFICFLSLLTIIYIGNAHHAEKKVRKIHSLKKEVKELEWQYTNVKSDIMYGSTPSQVVSKVNKIDLKVSDEMPKKIKSREK